jgi:hypothetical protein
MRLAEGQGSLVQEEEGRKEACHSQAAERIRPYHHIPEQRRGYQGNREVLQGLGNGLVVGIAAAAGQEGSRKEEEGMAAAADQAGHGIEAAADWEPAGGVAAAAAAAAVAEQGALTAINVSDCSLLIRLLHRSRGCKTQSWVTAWLPLYSSYASSAIATYTPRLHPLLKSYAFQQRAELNNVLP